MSNESIEQRVERERKAHDVDDVLARNMRLKAHFAHYDFMPYLSRRDEYLREVRNEMKGRRVLDYGCGRGETAIQFLRSGAFVFGIDLSENYVNAATQLAKNAGFAENTDFRFEVMDAHRLRFDDDSFDFVIGKAILHHLDLSVAIPEIRRVLKSHGRAIFEEPLKHNPLLRLYRWMTPKARTLDEMPLSEEDLERIGRGFETKAQFYGLLNLPAAVFTSFVLRPFPRNPLLALADKAEVQLNRLPVLRKFNQEVLLDMEKP